MCILGVVFIWLTASDRVNSNALLIVGICMVAGAAIGLISTLFITSMCICCRRSKDTKDTNTKVAVVVDGMGKQQKASPQSVVIHNYPAPQTYQQPVSVHRSSRSSDAYFSSTILLRSLLLLVIQFTHLFLLSSRLLLISVLHHHLTRRPQCRCRRQARWQTSRFQSTRCQSETCAQLAVSSQQIQVN